MAGVGGALAVGDAGNPDSVALTTFQGGDLAGGAIGAAGQRRSIPAAGHCAVRPGTKH